MKKTILLFIALLLSFQWVAAQSISDDEVIRIVLAEKEMGRDEKSIAQKLLRQGVTPAQLRRIKAKYEQEQKGMGVLDVTTINRNRNKDNVSGKNGAVKTRKGENFMLKDGRVSYDNLQKRELLQEEMGFLDIDSVVYYNNLLKSIFSYFWDKQLIGKLKKLDAFVVLTKDDKEKWTELKKVHIIPNPLPFYTEEKADDMSTKLISVGRYSHEKGFDRLVKIWANVSRKYSDWTLHIYGSGNSVNLENMARELSVEKTIFFHGPTKQLEENFQKEQKNDDN